MIDHLSAALRFVNSGALRHAISAGLSNVRMRTVEEVRRARLAQLVEEYGSYVKLGEKLGLTERDSTLSQIANQSVNSRTTTPKTMGSTLARRIETACRKPVGWMDTDPNLWPFDQVDLGRVQALPQRDRDRLEGGLLLVAAQMGLEVKRDAA